MRRPGRRQQASGRGFTLVEIMIVVGIFGILLTIAIPSWLSARRKAREKSCHENQMKLLGAIEVWAFEEGAQAGDAGPDQSEIVGADKFLRSMPACPASNDAYAIPNVGDYTVCPNIDTYPGHELPQAKTTP